MLEKTCSIYAHVKDTFGEYFDPETGEIIRQMSIRDFLLTDRWKPQVTQLHRMLAEQQGMAAKKTEEYQRIKCSLPGATLSGVFGTHRRIAECVERTGYIALDIDTGDNPDAACFAKIPMVLRFRLEVEVLMHSCSGQGYLALVRLAYPERIKEQFNALYLEYKELGITLDCACSDITRLRFATWDAKPYIRPEAQVVPYMGISEVKKIDIKAVPQCPTEHHVRDQESDADRVERIVRKIEVRCVDITGTYDDCFRMGVSLTNLGPCGLDFWKRICRFRLSSAHNHFVSASELDRVWRTIGTSHSISLGWFFSYCKDKGFTIK